VTYAIKEAYHTLQGEGGQAGRAAVFLRFAGCNLWSGREEDRDTAVCQFCDTDFVGTDGTNGGKFGTAEELAEHVESIWLSGARHDARRLVVCTGGEPMLQLDKEAIAALHDRGFTVAIETNGTQLCHEEIDWICVSPKAGAPLKQTSGNELKLVYPQQDIDPDDLVTLPFDHFYLQPKDGPNLRDNIDACIDYCLKDPRWQLSLQTHKFIGIE
jgi:7-carboxy-7-deazaguanine synthase (Cx14CxxC type)